MSASTRRPRVQLMGTGHTPSRLVALSAAAALIGTSADGMRALVARGAFKWVFDVGRGKRIRELRIFRACLEGDGRFKHWGAVLAHLAPGSAAGEIAGTWLVVQWQISRPTLKTLHDAGALDGRITNHKRLITVASLRRFLVERRVG